MRVSPPLAVHVAVLRGALAADGGPHKLDRVRDTRGDELVPALMPLPSADTMSHHLKSIWFIDGVAVPDGTFRADSNKAGMLEHTLKVACSVQMR